MDYILGTVCMKNDNNIDINMVPSNSNGNEI